MVYILGIHHGHDSSACLLENGNIVAMAEEERFVRIKHANKIFPKKSIEFCLRRANIQPKDVNYVAFSSNPSLQFPIYPSLARGYFSDLHVGLFRKGIWRKQLKLLGLSPEKTYFIEHHKAHAASAIRMAPFDSLCLITDGRGERNTTSAWINSNGDLKKIFEIKHPHSLGQLYMALTDYLGFQPLSDEWKVMGLAAYGKPNIDLSEFIKLNKRGFELNRRYFKRYFSSSSKSREYEIREIEKHFNVPRRVPESELTDFHKDLASSLQTKLKEILIRILENVKQNYNFRNLSFAGGVALNTKVNGELVDDGLVDSIFIQPAAHDAGTSLGAALEVAHELGFETQPIEHVYYGEDYEDLESLLAKNKLKYEKYDKTEIARLISENKVVGWFQGRFEWGPRALGNRSILANPSNPEMKDIVNNVVKFREAWRPFAPTILSEAIGEYLINVRVAPFMTVNFKVKEEKIKDLAAVTHVDGTTRPQTLERNTNQKYWEVIKEFENITGVPAVMNTSFNIRGDPIVNTPEEALRTFFLTGMDVLVLGDFVVKK